MDELVSVIVPVYNVEPYIDQCIKSILNQEYQNFELILIDNLSTDNSLERCREYEKKDSRIRVLENPQRGVSGTRNKGLEIARGDYIAFCDSDDEYNKAFLQKMLESAVMNEADITVSNYSYLKHEIKPICNRKSGWLDKNELCKRIFLDNTIGGFVWNKLFKASLVSSTRFDDSLQICEDTLFLCEIIQKSSRVYYVEDAMYYYRLRNTSSIASIDNVFDAGGNLKYIVSYNKIIKNKFVPLTYVSYILASEFLLSSGVKCDYKMANPIQTEERRLIIKKLNKTLRKTFLSFVFCREIPFKKKLVALGNSFFNLRKRKEILYRILAYCKAIARNILKYIKRSEYHLILKKKNSNYIPMPHEIYTRQKLEELCKFPKGKIDACNEIGDFYELSIIVPAYNVEQYIEKCVESILNQKTKYKFELIIVNDGSTDNTYSIIQQYKNRKNVVIINQENGGLSAARNSALKHINGKYLMFVDSDDYILPGAIDALLDKAIQNNADMVEGSAFSFYDNGKISRFFRHLGSSNSISPINTFYGYPWGKVIKSTLFSDIKFPDGFWFEDTLFVMILYPKATNSYTIKKEVYAYRVNMSGITQTAKKNYRSIESLWITEYLMGEQKKRNLLSESTYNQFFDQIAMNDARVRQLGNDVRKMVFEESVRLYQLYYKDCFFSIHSEKAKKLHNYIIAFNEEMALTLLENWNYL